MCAWAPAESICSVLSRVDFGAGFRGSVLLFFAGFLILDLLGSDA
jgi:hypothetical protein